jgi:hypothetical protein
LTDQSKPLQFTSRSEKRGCSKEHQFFQLLGLQIALNLVPTMNEHREMRDLKSAPRLSFFVARKFSRAAIFESLILEFITRLRERSERPWRKPGFGS